MDRISHMHHVEDIGRILLQAQDELKSIREQVQVGGGETTAQLDQVLQQAEKDLRTKAELVLSGVVNNSMRTLPPIPSPTVGPKVKESSVHEQYPGLDKNEEEKFLLPANQTDILRIKKRYGIPVAPPGHADQRKRAQRPIGRLIKKRTTVAQKLLPAINRNDPAAPAPALTEEDAKQGMLNLINRGFIPTGVDLTPALTYGDTMIKNEAMVVHDKPRHPIRSIPYVPNTTFNLATLHFDLSGDSEAKRTKEQEKVEEETKQLSANPVNLEFEGDNAEEETKATNQEVESAPIESIDELRRNVEKIRGYNQLLDTYSLHQFIIRRGHTLRETPEFISFQRTNLSQWDEICFVITALEKMLTDYAVPVAYIDGQQVVKCAVLESSELSVKQLMSCIINEEQVGRVVHRIGQRFKGANRVHNAAACIQSLLRMKLQKRRYDDHRATEGAAKNIQAIWRIFFSYRNLQKKLWSIRQQNEMQWDLLMRKFAANWDRIKTKRRVVVHIPSLSVDASSRLRMDNFLARQNMQMTRLCAIADPLVDVVYVSPYEITDDVRSYYMRLMELGGVPDPESRIRIVTPENSHRFPSHFNLSTVLLYSPHCMRRIKRYIRGKEAYLVMGAAGVEDKRVAMTLNLPILGADPKKNPLFSSKSGALRLFMEADVNIPIGAYDIYDQSDLRRTLVQLIVKNIHIERWLIKIDHDYEASGICYIDVNKMKTVRNVRKEKEINEGMDPSYWNDDEVLESARATINSELDRKLEKFIHLCFPEVYPDWNAFNTALTKYGVVVEAMPEKVLGYYRTNIFIEPTGKAHVTSTQDLWVSSSNQYQFWGSAFPQSLVPHAAAQGSSLSIGGVLFKKGLTGYASVDFVTFQETSTSKQRLWALRISPYLTDSAMGFVLFNFLVGGYYDPKTGRYHTVDAGTSSSVNSSLATGQSIHTASIASITSMEGNSTASQKQSVLQMKGPERYYSVQEYVYHPNLSTMQYSSFFNTCRMHGVCYDLENRLGTAFILTDSLAGGVLGLLSIGSTKKEALRYLSTGFEMVNHHVGRNDIPDRLEGGVFRGNFVDILATIRKLREKLGVRSLKPSSTSKTRQR